ncbi:hypothetical protein ACTJJB_23695 [Chitinophaga sp. 22536]|uniref:hypothetical protein n=1 Tax=unclassified Chitinophaga TaxID=2619133 RepID=UPI003F87B895
MKANVQYGDFKGSAAADISDSLSRLAGNSLKGIGKYFKLDEKRFDPVGISIYGTDHFYISLLCVDKNKSKEGKEHIVSMSMDVADDREILRILFKRLNIVLYSRFDTQYENLNYDQEVLYSDYHESDED